MPGSSASCRSTDSQTAVPVLASFRGGDQPRRRPRVQSLSLGIAPFRPRYGDAHHPASATELKCNGPPLARGHEYGSVECLLTASICSAIACVTTSMHASWCSHAIGPDITGSRLCSEAVSFARRFRGGLS
jgi:hypothetical protein